MWGQHLPLQLPISNSNSLALFGRHSICVSHLGNLPIFSFFFVVVLPRRNKPKQFTFLFLNVFWWRWRWASLFTERPTLWRQKQWRWVHLVWRICLNLMQSTKTAPSSSIIISTDAESMIPGRGIQTDRVFFFFWSPVMCWRCSLHGLYFWGKKAYGSLKKGWRNYPKILTSFGHAKTLCLKAGCKKEITERWTKAR